MLIKWATHFSPKPRRVFVNHGDSEVCDLFTNRLKDEFGLAATSPFSGSTYDLVKNEYILEARPEPLAERGEREAHEERPQNTPYQQLLGALDRLGGLIRAGKGRSNRELRSVANQLNEISNEWEHE
jgi:metallo-beta-lactamase family protein